jgi:cyclohexadieny/prephenate dehydrogenase
LIGVGLIGSSIARAARKFKAAKTISVFDKSAAVCERAKKLGFADRIAPSAQEAVKHADLVILCVPAGAYAEVLKDIAPALKSGAIVSDTGSVKTSAAQALKSYLPDTTVIIPAHPVAGTEFSGPDAGFAELFCNRWCILTPDEHAPLDAVERVSIFWRALGAQVEVMSAEHHDSVLAITSHIPHLIAFNIVGTAADLEQVAQMEVIKYSAGGFRDFTRIASSDPIMWRDIFLHNKPAVLEMLERFLADLSFLQNAIEREDGDALYKHFTHTRAIRSAIIEAGQETSAPDFGRTLSKT